MIFLKFLGMISGYWAVAKYLRAAGVNPKLWNKLEKEAVERALLKKGGYMDIKEEIRQEGRWEGMREGRQEGMREGRQEGRQEGRREVIRNMLKEKTDLAFIAKVTGPVCKRH